MNRDITTLIILQRAKHIVRETGDNVKAWKGNENINLHSNHIS